MHQIMETKRKISYMRIRDTGYKQVCRYLVPIQGKAVRCEPSPQTRAMKCVSARQRLALLEINEANGASGIILQVLRGGIREPAHMIRAAVSRMRTLWVCCMRAWGRQLGIQ